MTQQGSSAGLDPVMFAVKVQLLLAHRVQVLGDIAVVLLRHLRRVHSRFSYEFSYEF